MKLKENIKEPWIPFLQEVNKLSSNIYFPSLTLITSVSFDSLLPKSKFCLKILHLKSICSISIMLLMTASFYM